MGYHLYRWYRNQLCLCTSPPHHLSFTANIQDLLVDPSTRDVTDVAHKITAVGSRSVESAEKFISNLKAYGDEPDNASSWGVKQGLLNDVKGYATYEEVFADKVSPHRNEAVNRPKD